MADLPSPSRSTHAVVVLGPVEIVYAEARTVDRLSPAKQQLLVRLVEAGERGIDAHAGEPDRVGVDDEPKKAAFRMAVSRLRAHFPPGAIEDAGDGVMRLVVPATEIDWWHLQALASGEARLEDVSTAQLRHLLQAPLRLNSQFAEIDPLDPEAPWRGIVRAQHDLIRRIGAEHIELLQGELVELVRRHRGHDPFDESLLCTLVMAVAQGGNRREALALIAQAREDFAEVGLTLSPAVDALELTLLDPRPGELDPEVPEPEPELPVALADLRSRPHVGHREGLESLRGLVEAGRGVGVVRGPSGIGKTRLCAEVAASASERYMPTVYLRATAGGSDTVFAPLVRSLPDFRDQAAPILDQPDSIDIEEVRSLLLAQGLSAMATRVGAGGLLVVVDDAHDIDSGTARLIRQLLLSDLASKLVLVVAVTEEQEAARPGDFVAELLDRSDAVAVAPGPLSDEELMELVVAHRPGIFPNLAWNLAREVGELANGRAGVASILLEATADGAVADRPDLGRLRGAQPFVQLGRELSPEAQRVGAVAAVMGREIDVEAVAAVAECSPSTVRAALTELVERNFAIERKDPIEWGFNHGESSGYELTHALTVAALMRLFPEEQVADWHAAASVHFADRIHRRAAHEFEAGGRVPNEQVVASLAQSASQHLATGAYWEAVGDFRKMMVLTEGRVDPQLAPGYARALELAGYAKQASRVRDNGIAELLTAGDHEGALSLTVSGLPEGEIFEGEHALIERLRSIHPDRLGRVSQHGLACHLARQLAIFGEADEAAEQADRALGLAESSTEIVAATLAKRFTISCSTAPEVRLRLLEAVEEHANRTTATLRAEYFFLRTLDAYEAGHPDEAAKWRARLSDLDDAPLVRLWHGMLFDAMAARDAGHLAEAERLAEAARVFGISCGIATAQMAFDASRLTNLWLAGLLAVMADQVGEGKLLDPGASQFGRLFGDVVAAGALDAVGRTDEAEPHAVAVADQALRSPVGQRSTAAAYVAEALGNSRRTDLAQSVCELLERRGPRSAVVLGACVSSVGPLAAHLAHLTPKDDLETRSRYMHEAIEVAVDAGWETWVAYLRYRWALMTNDECAIHELRQTYAGTELSVIVGGVS